nr:uncharacterized protein LOC115255057 [Aedes albopictus]
MKFLFSVVVGVAVVASLCSAEYSKKEIKGILNGARECVSQLKIGPDASTFVQGVMYNRDVKNDIKTKKYIKCVMDSMGLLDSDGAIQTQVIVDYFKDNYDEQLLKKLMKTCGQPEGETVEEKTWNFYNCCFANKEFDI